MKKTILLCLAIASISVSINAQTFTTQPNDTVIAYLANNTTGQYKIQQINNTGGTLSLDLVIVENTFPAGWDGMVCIFGSCLGHIPVAGYTASQANLVNTTDTGYVRLTADPLGIGGGGKLRIYVYDVNLPNVGDTLTWIINPVTISIQELSNSFEAKITPNPSKSRTTITSTKLIEKIELYSITGELIRSVGFIKSDKFIINVEELPSGIYIAKVIGEDNKYSTQKLIVN
ncbi:MAG: hypothetical protein COB15_08040 [Flavobacteriales bacterium]|nr:MAG: hypothetical protein COB15_08040 [Flavobacteriales bacterium]